MRTLTVLAPGTFASLQDAGRPGWAHVGVGHSGAADRGSHHLANRLVGNPTDSATIECLLGGLTARADADVVVAVTGAPCPVRVNGRDADHHAPLYLRGGDELSLGLPEAGLRCYVAASGGFDVDPVLGSRSWDSLAGLGPAPLRAGAVLPLGQAAADGARVDHAPVLLPTLETLTVTVIPGPARTGWRTAWPPWASAPGWCRRIPIAWASASTACRCCAQPLSRTPNCPARASSGARYKCPRAGYLWCSAAITP